MKRTIYCGQLGFILGLQVCQSIQISIHIAHPINLRKNEQDKIMSVNAVGMGGEGRKVFDNILYLFMIVKISQRNKNRVESPHTDKENPHTQRKHNRVNIILYGKRLNS